MLVVSTEREQVGVIEIADIGGGGGGDDDGDNDEYDEYGGRAEPVRALGAVARNPCAHAIALPAPTTRYRTSAEAQQQERLLWTF